MRILNPKTGESGRPEDLLEDMAHDCGEAGTPLAEDQFLLDLVFAFPNMGIQWYFDICERWIDTSFARTEIEAAVAKSKDKSNGSDTIGTTPQRI